MLWLIYLVNCLFLFHYLFFQEFSLALSIESSSSACSFCSTFSTSMNLGEIVTFCRLEWMSLCGSIPVQTVCAQRLWQGWVWIWHGCKSHHSSACAGAVTLLGGGLEVKGPELSHTAWRGTSPLLRDHHYPISGSDPKWLEWKPRVSGPS